MQRFKPYTLNLGGRLTMVDKPLVMAILNTTPDSFFSVSRCPQKEAISQRVRQMVEEGADIIDIGGYSSRPNADDVPADEEYRRVEEGLRIVREVAPQISVSVDTFRASVAERCVGEWGVEIINDIAAGGLDPDMIATVGRVKAAYIMMHMRGNPHTMTSLCDYDDVVADILQYFCRKINEAQQAGICDIILDPGFGFSKTLDQNYELLSRMDAFLETGLPLLVGVSRKSMIYKLFGTTPDEALNGTTAINTIALMQGASILRVHDVKAAREAVEIFCKTFPNE